MTKPDLTYLRKLLEDGWDGEVLGANPTHPLGLRQKKNPDNPGVKCTQGLARAILTSKRIRKLKRLRTSKVEKYAVEARGCDR